MYSIFATILLYVIWAALHDIARGDSDIVEFTAVAIAVPALFALSAAALRHMAPRGRRRWLIAAAGLLALFVAAGLSSALAPKYPNDVPVALAVLAVALPSIAYTAWRLRTAT
jgi:drug/metabolite transporter (DMT)-like permease